jgi:hypothetical protein
MQYAYQYAKYAIRQYAEYDANKNATNIHHQQFRPVRSHH